MTRLKYAVLLVVFLSASAAMAADLSVANTNPACNDTAGVPFCTIGAALDIALSGDTITVADGVYAEPISIEKNDLIVRGIDHPTIPGLQVAFPCGVCSVCIAASRVGFEGFEISGAGTNGICVDSGSNNRVVGNWVLGSALSGIELGGVINVVTDNRVDNSRLLGIRVRGFGNNVLRNVAMNSHDRGFFVEGDRNILTNNQSVGNNFSGFAITGVRIDWLETLRQRTMVVFGWEGDLASGVTTDSSAMSRQRIGEPDLPILRFRVVVGK